MAFTSAECEQDPRSARGFTRDKEGHLTGTVSVTASWVAGPTADTDWEDLWNADNIDSKVEVLNLRLLECYDRHALLQSVCFKNLPASWITDVLRAAMRERDLARRVWRRRRDDTSYHRYKTFRNKVQSDIRFAKRAYFLSVFERSDNPNVIWSRLRHLGLVKSKDTDGPLRHSVDELNNFFVQSTDEGDTDGMSSIDLSEIEFDDNNFYWKHITLSVILSAISRLKSNATGSDGITPRLIKLVLPCIMPVLEHIFNFSLTHGAFPSQWKSTLVCPIPKTKNPTSVQNYRPISVLPALSKVLERVWRNKYAPISWPTISSIPIKLPIRKGILHKHLIESNIRSCLGNYEIYGSLALPWNGFCHTWKVDHRWYEMECTISAEAAVKVGVPQGSVLGPLHFILYLSGFISILRHCKYNFYADDLQIYFHCEPRKLEAIAKINADIASVVNWSASNGLILNAAQAIIIGTARYINAMEVSQLPPIRIEGDVVQYATQIKYLGVVIANNLSWEHHISNTLRKVRSTLYQLKLCKHLMPDTLRAKLITTLIFPHFDYCCAAFTNITAEQDLKLYRAMNACVRFVHRMRYDEHVTPHYIQLQWLKPDSRRQYFICCLLFNIIKTQIPGFLYSGFTSRSVESGRDSWVDDAWLRRDGNLIELHNRPSSQAQWAQSDIPADFTAEVRNHLTETFGN
ncbi:PREDICTED: RNA-directed DNA polymerase from mobile element jockey-like [Wasmannia auropunctata]|uniref:RNA-directed DNA polymerase from mobile element jockey-like n=1 Tax=Wasmannia auropunctata TaxID=64793 RepID=UPI0005EF8925|nr:PREDICTED: RNA-directed DNA polymerase from mobile element jockey-like [Wasmannia auropunctata]